MSIYHPNIILITADPLRADHVSPFGGSVTLSPNLHAIAQESTIFKKAYSDGPNTPHAFPAIMSGRSALACNKLGLFECTVSLAEALKANGYATIAINAGNPYLSRHFRYDRGFDIFSDFIEYNIDLHNGHDGNNHISIPAADMEHYILNDDTISQKMQLEQDFNTHIIRALESCPQRGDGFCKMVGIDFQQQRLAVGHLMGREFDRIKPNLRLGFGAARWQPYSGQYDQDDNCDDDGTKRFHI